jgi:hypothetical protein
LSHLAGEAVWEGEVEKSVNSAKSISHFAEHREHHLLSDSKEIHHEAFFYDGRVYDCFGPLNEEFGGSCSEAVWRRGPPERPANGGLGASS